MRNAPVRTPQSSGAADLIVVTAPSGTSVDAAIALARSLELRYQETPTAPLHLLAMADRLELRDVVTGARLWVEYTPAELQRYRAGGSGPNPLRRAIGPAPRSVLDATGGLGRDAVHIASLGYQVTAIERHPIVSALAQSGIAQARANGHLSPEHLTWRTGDSRAILATLDPPAATIYLDPMFPPKRKKSAAVRKEMHLLRLLVADDADAEELLALARTCAADRVVVKRPENAPPLAAAPSASYRGRLVRYDVYRTCAP